MLVFKVTVEKKTNKILTEVLTLVRKLKAEGLG